jgi:hypothetical protein
LGAASRKVSHHAAAAAAAAQHKENVFRKIQTQGNCGPWKQLVTADRKITCCAKVA